MARVLHQQRYRRRDTLSPPPGKDQGWIHGLRGRRRRVLAQSYDLGLVELLENFRKPRLSTRGERWGEARRSGASLQEFGGRELAGGFFEGGEGMAVRKGGTVYQAVNETGLCIRQVWKDEHF